MSERRNENDNIIKKVWNGIKKHWRNPLVIIAIMAYLACIVVGIYDIIVCWNNVRNAMLLVGLTVVVMLLIVTVFLSKDANGLLPYCLLVVSGIVMTGVLISGAITSLQWIFADNARTLAFLSIIFTLVVIFLIQVICQSVDKSKRARMAKKQRAQQKAQQRGNSNQNQLKHRPNAKR